MIKISIDDSAIVAELKRLENASRNLRPALKEIGEI